MPFKKPILSDFGVCARYLPMQSALQQVFGSYDIHVVGAAPRLSASPSRGREELTCFKSSTQQEATSPNSREKVDGIAVGRI